MPCEIVASDETFSVGDVVQLISDGPKMTVTGISEASAYGGEAGRVLCVWFAGAKEQSGSFKPQTLKKLTNDDSE